MKMATSYRADSPVMAQVFAACYVARERGVAPRTIAVGFDVARAVSAEVGPMFSPASRVAVERIRGELVASDGVAWVEDPELAADAIEIRDSL